MTAIDWRAPEWRREAFQRFYSFHLRYRTHPGLVYIWLPVLADVFDAVGDEERLAWIVWLNGNTQNPVTTSLLLEAAPRPEDWRRAVDYWNEHYSDLEWDNDRRLCKYTFGEATARWADETRGAGWTAAARGGWPGVWAYSKSHAYMGRLSAWSMAEFARILIPGLPDADKLMLEYASASRSHRNGLGLIAGYDATYWDAKEATPRRVAELTVLGEELLAEARVRVSNRDRLQDVGYLTMESALCTYKSWHKPNRRYPNVYADIAHRRLLRAEARFGQRFEHLWEARAAVLPAPLRLESTPYDPGVAAIKQNWYLDTGSIPMIGHMFPDMWSEFDDAVLAEAFPLRNDRWIR